MIQNATVERQDVTQETDYLELKRVTIVIVKDRQALMLWRPHDSSRYRGKWCFPGVAMKDRDGSPQACLERGVMEEFKLFVEQGDCSYAMTYTHDGNVVDEVHVVHLINQEPKLKEGQALVWKSFAEIEKLELAFDQRKILDWVKVPIQNGS